MVLELDLEMMPADSGGQDCNLYNYDANNNPKSKSDSSDDETIDDLPDAELPSGSQAWDQNVDPSEGMEFDSEQNARFFYNAYARRIGFSTRSASTRRSMRDSSIIARQLVCACQGFHKRKNQDVKIIRKNHTTRVGCKAQMRIKKLNSGKWKIVNFVKEHNHQLVPPEEVHNLRSHKRIAGPVRSLIDTLQAAGLGAASVMSVLIKESGGKNNVGFKRKDCQNYMALKTRGLGPGGGKLVFDYLNRMKDQDPGFFYAVQSNSEIPAGNIFWVDSNSIKNYSCFGDTVIFDTTYRINQYRVPFAAFTGWNHHGQPLLFGSAILLCESEASYVWLFENWLAAMSGRCPKSITTDHDTIIGTAVSEVLPQSRHRSCTWIVFREAQEKLADVYFANPNLEKEFQRCIHKTDSVEEFEQCWESMARRYNLENHEWVQSIYRDRKQWAPVYFRDTFFGDGVTAHRRNSMSSYFDGYIDASTTIRKFIENYEAAVAYQTDKEIKTDYNELSTTVPPVLRTPSPIEKQAAKLYTISALKLFQEELLETLSYTATVVEDEGLEIVYQVAKFAEHQKGSLVKFDVFEKKADCSCRRFEFSGVVCRHILVIFKVTNVFSLPSCFFIRRWRKNSRNAIVLDEESVGVPRFQYENLCQEALKYVKEGAESVPIYKAAVDALLLAARKVAAAKLCDPGFAVAPCQDESGDSVFCSSDDDPDKKIQELTYALENANEQCEAYQAKLLAIQKNMEDEKLRIAVKVRDARFNISRIDTTINPA